MKIELELKNGKRRSFAAPVAKVLMSRGMGKEVPTYQTRMMTAEAPKSQEKEEAPYGYKADGTPRQRPGRRNVSE